MTETPYARFQFSGRGFVRSLHRNRFVPFYQFLLVEHHIPGGLRPNISAARSDTTEYDDKDAATIGMVALNFIAFSRVVSRY
jgi:hypothetical protein